MGIFPLYGPKGNLAVEDKNGDGIFNAASDEIHSDVTGAQVIKERLLGMGLDLRSLEGAKLRPLSEYTEKLRSVDRLKDPCCADVMDIYVRGAEEKAAEAGISFDVSRIKQPEVKVCYRQGAAELLERGKKTCDGYLSDMWKTCMTPFTYRSAVFRELGGTYVDDLLEEHPVARKIFYSLMYLGTLTNTKRDISEGNINMISSNLRLLDIYADKGNFVSEPSVASQLYALGYERELKAAKDTAENAYDREMSIESALKWAKEGGIEVDRAQIAEIRKSKYKR